ALRKGMTKVSTKQRTISAADLRSPEFMRVPDEAKLTAMGLWVHTDVFGRRRLIPELIAADLYPGRAMTDSVTDHLLMLDEAGFLTIYRVEGIECIQLARPLKADRRGATTDCPEPPQGLPWTSMAVGGAGASGRASARERARAQMGEQARVRADEWAAWEGQQERGRSQEPPRRPLLADAPPIGCPEHPHGTFQNCGPCGTGRRRHDRWVSEARYEDALTGHYAADGEDPFEGYCASNPGG
ncbi:MAG: hypothetical protein ACTH0V_18145, partial [Microbacteriaceae bacterium]